MSEFTEIYAQLTPQNQKEAADFVEFLYKKQEDETQKLFDWEKFRAKLLKMSVWDEESLTAMENARKSSKFKIQSW